MNELILSKLEVAKVNGVDQAKLFGFANMVDPVGGVLTAVALTSNEVDADPTLGANTINTAAFDANEAVDITLPPATVGTYVIWRQSALADEANAMDWICAGTDTFEANQVVSVGELVAQNDTSVGTDVKLIITPAATNPGWGQVGSQCHFLCRQDGKWLVKVQGMKLGTGAVGTLSFA